MSFSKVPIYIWMLLRVQFARHCSILSKGSRNLQRILRTIFLLQWPFPFIISWPRHFLPRRHLLHPLLRRIPSFFSLTMIFFFFFNPLLLSSNHLVWLMRANFSFVQAFIIISSPTLLLASNTIFSSQLFHIRARPTLFDLNHFSLCAKMIFPLSKLNLRRHAPSTTKLSLKLPRNISL
jgi:hypothetical protein